ncbi:MAG: sulfatase [Actinomycetota bacterium]
MALASISAFTPAGPSPSPTNSPPPTTKPNVLLIVTDDQEYKTLSAMSVVGNRLVDKGVKFTNGFVTNPMCCPSRTSILTGDYSHTTGVYENHHGFESFDDHSTVATWLNGAGYDTALIGRYLNAYQPPYIPPGWDHWVAKTNGGGVYYHYSLTDDGHTEQYGGAPRDYLTDVLANKAVSFLDDSVGKPFFLMFTPNAPHSPAEPAQKYLHAFPNLPRWRPRSYDEAQVRDKPDWVRKHDRLSPAQQRAIDAFRHDQLRTLLSVNDAIRRMLDELYATGRIANTLILFTTDNGYLWGEHRLVGKSVPYEESIRVPFVVRYDALGIKPREDGHQVLNIDIAPTIAQLAGVSDHGADGRSLLPLLRDPKAPWRTQFLAEHIAGGAMPAWCEVHGTGHAYIYYADGEQELYDLNKDPYELRNIADSTRLSGYRHRLRQLCRPAPPGLKLP